MHSGNSVSTASIPMKDRVTIVDVLFCVSKFAAAQSNAKEATGDAEPAKIAKNTITEGRTVLNDRRIVRATGAHVHSDTLGKVLSFSSRPVEGRLLKSIPIATNDCLGLAVNPTETLMVVTSCEFADHPHTNMLYLYSLPGGELLKAIGGSAADDDDDDDDDDSDSGGSDEDEDDSDSGGVTAETIKFKKLCRAAFGPDDSIMVADAGNKVLHEFTSTGVYKRGITTVKKPFAVAFDKTNGIIAVGNGVLDIVLLEYSTGSVIRRFNAGDIDVDDPSIVEVCFSRDGKKLFSMLSDTEFISVFSVADGSLIKEISAGMKGAYIRGIGVTEHGELVVVESESDRVLVYDEDGDGVLAQWRCGSALFGFALAVCPVGNRLYILGRSHPVVQVYA